MATLIEQLGHRLSKVRITALTDGAFHAVLVLDSDGDQVATEVDSRSSDAIALALRTGATIEADEDLLDEVGVHMDEEGEESDGDDEAPSEDVLAEFKEFLDNVSPEDFETDEPPAQS
jgi:bifunctional DNase/RNase